MAKTSALHNIGTRCRDVAAALLGGLWIGRDAEDVMQQIETLPSRIQVAFTVGTLTFLAGASFFAAQFGWLGLLIFWLGVVAVIA